MKTPNLLIPALRQYASNTKKGDLFAGYDYDKTNDIVQDLTQQLAEAQAANEQLSGVIDGMPKQSLLEIKVDALREFAQHQVWANEEGYSLDIYEYADKLEQAEQLRQQGEE